MQKCLVVCYSRTGWTARVGRAIAEMRGADFELIREERSRTGAWGFLRSVRDSLFGGEPAIVRPEKDPGEYATVILGTPVWAGHMSAPMRSYILRNRDRFHRLGLFCTMGGSGGDKVLKEMETLCSKSAEAKLVVVEAEIINSRFESKLAVMQERQIAHPLY